MFQDAAKILLAKQDVKTLLETIQKQQQQFSDVPEQLPLDPAIPITFTKVNVLYVLLIEPAFSIPCSAVMLKVFAL